MHIVYFSPTGGTRKAAYIIGKEIDPQATEIDITDHTRPVSYTHLTLPTNSLV